MGDEKLVGSSRDRVGRVWGRMKRGIGRSGLVARGYRTGSCVTEWRKRSKEGLNRGHRRSAPVGRSYR